GLGLTISAQLISLMDGRIWVESDIGKGSNFHFVINLGLAAAAPTPATPSDLEGLAVLVVDDNATNRRILDEILRQWRMHPVLVESGAAGLEDMQRAWEAGQPFPLVLFDHVMPEMDGLEFARRVRERGEFHNCQMVLLSSVFAADHVARCRDLNIGR